MPFAVSALDHLVINVSDVERSAAWYGRVLGMARRDTIQQEGQPPRTAMHFGRQKVNLRPVGESKGAWFTADKAAAGSDDLCFLVEVSPANVVAHLRECGVAVIDGPGPRSGARGPITSVYCRDPDGSLIEIASYPG